MAWTPPARVADGDYWKASDYNRDIRNNLAESEAAVADTRGDIVVSAGPGTLTAGRVYVQDIGDAPIMTTTNTEWQRLTDVPPLSGVRATNTICVMIGGSLIMAYFGVRLVDSDGTAVVTPERGRSAVNGLAPMRASSHVFAYTVPSSVYSIELWGCKNHWSGQGGNGIIQRARLAVIAF